MNGKIIKAAVLVATLNTPVQGSEIRQEQYEFCLPLPVTIPAHETFVITDRTVRVPPTLSIPPVVFFELGSSWLSPAEGTRLLASVRQCGGSSFLVSGYSCSLGKEEQNEQLSCARAEAVAVLLRQQGFTVKVEGRGPLPGANAENRRVEVLPSS